MQFVVLITSVGMLLACGGSSKMMAGDGMPLAMSRNLGATPQSIVVKASLSIDVRSVSQLMEGARVQIQSLDGHISREENADSERGSMRVRLPTANLSTLLKWLEGQGGVSKFRTTSVDVSKDVFDHELALDSLGKTLTRMQELLQRPELDIDAILKIESEMSRVRSEMERIQGELRFVRDRVSLATLDIQVRSSEEKSIERARPGVRLTHLRLLDPGTRSADRFGVGLSVGIPHVDRLSYSLDLFKAAEGEKSVITATVGGAVHSKKLGQGRGIFIPYLGGRIGYGRLQGSNFVLIGEAGIEVINNEHLTFEVNTQLTSFFGKGGPDVALVSGLELSVAF